MKAKIKKGLVLLGCILIGALITTATDHLIGVSQLLEDISSVTWLVHAGVYMLYGAAISSCMN